MVVKISFGGQITSVIPEGSEVLFKLDDEGILKIKTNSDIKPQSQVYASQYSAGVITYYSFTFDLDKESLTKLSAAKKILIRGPSPLKEGETFDINPNNRGGKKCSKEIINGSKCMLESM